MAKVAESFLDSTKWIHTKELCIYIIPISL